MFLSKSKYCQLWQCPKLLWLDENRPDQKTPDPSREDRMAIGNEVGDLAMGLFGTFTETTILKEDGWPDIPAMLKKTRQCIDEGVENICEAAFSYQGLYCAVDILRKEKDGYAIYEVKSSTHASRIYGVDIAYQKYVLEHCGIRVTGTYLVCINTGYIRGESLDLQGLFQVIDMAKPVAEEYPLVESRLKLADQTLSSEVEPSLSIGNHCRDPYKCPYWHYCTRELPSPSAFDLYNLSFQKAMEYYHSGLVSFPDLAGLPQLNEKQQRQIRHQLSDLADEINKEKIRDFLSTLHYPIYFFDFESMQQPIPQHPGCKPYAQIPFQYSLHYIDAPGGELMHKEFLAQSGTDPLRTIAESICRDIPADACVVAYNRNFECARLKELAELFPDLASHLLSVRKNIKDLWVPFRSGFYYNRAMGGSFSIKSVLPALFPNEPDLDYHNLEGIHNGGEAMSIFPRIKDMPPEEAAIARKNLLAYCKLDTYALVKIWQRLMEVSR